MRGWIAAGLVLLIVGLFGCASPPREPQSAAPPIEASEPSNGTSASSAPVEREYRPGGERFEQAWNDFYGADHEAEIDDPLIAAGPDMVPAICEAVAHKDLKLRRYALGALGYIGDPTALPTLRRILQDATEIDYFRGDALAAIYRIDRNEAKRLAAEYRDDVEYLATTARDVQEDAPYLSAPSVEE